MGARYSQHFLRNRGAIDTIVRRFDPRPEDAVVELGAGRGALTGELAARAGALAAIEIDRGLAADLSRSLALPLMPADRLRSPRADAGRRFVVQADALEVRYRDLAEHLVLEEGRRLRVIGNLPYAVGTALVRRAIAARDLVSDALVMVQKEVADRILANPGTKEYGFLTVLAALGAERKRVMTLEPGSFDPPPKVRSCVVSLVFAKPDDGFEEADARLEDVLRAAFTERRKKLASNLAKAYALPRPEVVALLSACGADPEARAEALAPETFAKLASVLPSPTSSPRPARC